MNKNTTSDFARQMRIISQLDLECVKKRLMDPESGQGWDQEKADACEVEYKRFLMLAAKFQRAGIVPSVEVDHFWHAHILDTRKYAKDCIGALGFFLHHAPHKGDREAEDVVKLESAFAETKKLYAQLFEGEVGQDAAWCGVADKKDAQRAAWCGVADKKDAQRAAWCGVADKKDAQRAAWCGVADKKDAQRAAWCGVANVKDVQRAAWCGVAGETDAQRAAWCGVADERPQVGEPRVANACAN